MTAKSNTKRHNCAPRASIGECPALSPTAQIFVKAAYYVLDQWDGETTLTLLQRSALCLCRSCPPDLLPELCACMRLRGEALRHRLAPLRVKLLPHEPLLAAVLV